MATERDLLMWCRSLFFTVTFGALMGKVVLGLYHERGDLLNALAGLLREVGSIGSVSIVLGSAVLLAGLIVRRARISRCARAGAILLACAVLLSPCFAGKVKTFVDPDANFPSYKTYQWMPTRILAKTGVVEDDPAISPIVKSAVNRELTARGLKEVSEGGDLQIITCVLNTYIPQLEAYIFPLGVPYDYPSPLAAMTRYNREGTLAIGLVDSHTKKSAWAGLITESIDSKPGGGIKKIPKATETLFKKYPVKKQ